MATVKTNAGANLNLSHLYVQKLVLRFNSVIWEWYLRSIFFYHHFNEI